MGKYLQMGICYRMEIDKNRLDKLGVTFERLTIELKKHFELTLYDLNETQDEIIFQIKESVILEQLQEFMQYQYSMYPKEQPYTDCFESALQMIGELSSLKEIIELAEEKKYPCFQSNKVTDEIAVYPGWLRLDTSLLVFFVEGKIIMEGYNPLLRFIENNVRESNDKWSIAGAFKCYID